MVPAQGFTSARIFSPKLNFAALAAVGSGGSRSEVKGGRSVHPTRIEAEGQRSLRAR